MVDKHRSVLSLLVIGKCKLKLQWDIASYLWHPCLIKKKTGSMKCCWRGKTTELSFTASRVNPLVQRKMEGHCLSTLEASNFSDSLLAFRRWHQVYTATFKRKRKIGVTDWNFLNFWLLSLFSTCYNKGEFLQLYATNLSACGPIPSPIKFSERFCSWFCSFFPVLIIFFSFPTAIFQWAR